MPQEPVYRGQAEGTAVAHVPQGGGALGEQVEAAPEKVDVFGVVREKRR